MMRMGNYKYLVCISPLGLEVKPFKTSKYDTIASIRSHTTEQCDLLCFNEFPRDIGKQSSK